MRSFLTIILISFFGVSFSQSFSYPSIKKKGRILNDFVPPGWNILDSAKGDLNKDYIDDAAIILQFKDSVKLVAPEEDTVITQPRIFLIMFKDTSDNNFYLIEQSNSFILNHDNSAMEDPYQQLIIDKGLLQIYFNLFYNMGSWYVTNASYKFRYQNKEFVLIGADYFSFHRASHDYEEYSYNFLAKKRSLKKGNENEGTEKTSWKTLPNSTLKTLKTLKKPFSWQVETDVYL